MAQINKPSSYFNTVLYTGNGSTQSISGVGFQPDMTWVKSRTTGGSTNNNHCINDVVRAKGSFGYPMIHPNLTAVEYDPTSGNEVVIDFQSDGFSLGGNENSNYNTATYASWNWKAGGTASSNTDGSITSSVSASTTSGFSIVKWLGDSSASATVGHGLGTAPACIISKELNGTDWWHVWHKNLTNPNNVFLNETAAEQAPSDGTISNIGASTFGFQGATNVVAVNESGKDYIAYCFAEKKGFSKFGSYTGNGSADGTFVYTGFKPAFVIFKKSSSANDWIMKDSVREPNNQMAYRLKPNSSAAEDSLSGGQMDFLSNGFKFRVNDDVSNASGGTYIYMAFAENPLVGTNNIPATAR